MEVIVEQKPNQLVTIIQESGLEQSKAKFILDNFQKSFALADEWANKARAIVVTNENQKDDMKIARIGRLALREERIRIEKARKDLKEQALREGKAIDGIANVLKALIVPIEEYLDKQEHFAEIQEEKKREAIRIEVEKKMEEERIAKEKAEAEERERIRIENEKLKKEVIERERQVQEERKKQEEVLRKEREKAEAERKALELEARKKQEAIEKKMAQERAEAEANRKQAEEKARKEREVLEEQRRKTEEKARKEKEAAEAKEKAMKKEQERLQEMLKNQVECPNCHHKFTPNKEKK